MMLRLATVQDRNRWNNFVLSSPRSSFLQTWQWGKMQEKLGVKYWRLVVEHEGQIRAVALVIRRELPFGKCWLYVPRGPIVSKSGETPTSPQGLRGAGSKSSDYSKVWKVLQGKFVELAEQEKAIFVRVDPAVLEKRGQEYFLRHGGGPAPFLASPATGVAAAVLLQREGGQGTGWRKSEREVQPRHTLLLDLTKSEEELMTSMHSKTRYNIRLSERKGVAVRFSTDPEDVNVFLQLSREVSDRSGFHYHPDDYYRTMIETLSNIPPDKGGVRGVGEQRNLSKPPLIRGGVAAELAIAEHEGDPLAVHIMIYAGNTATYVHGASGINKKNLMGPVHLYWKTIRCAKEKGYKIYDFFGIAPKDATSDHPWAGVTRVKTGFGGQREDYIGAYDLVLEPGMYGIFNTARRMRELLR